VMVKRYFYSIVPPLYKGAIVTESTRRASSNVKL